MLPYRMRLQDLVPQLSAEEQVLVATQHPFATPAWLNSLVALSQGQLTEDLLLILSLCVTYLLRWNFFFVRPSQ